MAGKRNTDIPHSPGEIKPSSVAEEAIAPPMYTPTILPVVTVGAEPYITFETKVVGLDEELSKLANRARLLGSSADILAASTRLREGLRQVLPLFKETAFVFHREDMEIHTRNHPSPLRDIQIRRPKLPTEDLAKRSASNQRKKTSLVSEMRRACQDVSNLCQCFEHSAAVREELHGMSVTEELHEWANLMDQFKDDMDSKAIQKYLFDSLDNIGRHFEVLSQRFIPVFTETGLSTVKASRKQEISLLENQTVVAALFAGIATTMVQTYTGPGLGEGSLETANLTLWYICLVLSISSAVNGLLGLSWAQTIYTFPNHHIPWWLLLWMRELPLVSLILAIICSFVALILIAFMPSQSRVTLVVTTVLAAASCIGLLGILLWFICELLVISRTDGRKLLGDVIRDIRGYGHGLFVELGLYVRCKKPIRAARPEESDLEKGEEDKALPRISSGIPSDLSPSDRSRLRWRIAIRRVIQNNLPEERRLLMSSVLEELHWQALQVQTAKDLRTMSPSSYYPTRDKHLGTIRSLRFSPDGKFLLCSSVSTRNIQHMLLPVSAAGTISDGRTLAIHSCTKLDWSPDSKNLRVLARSNKKWEIWAPDEASGVVRSGSAGGRKVWCANWNGNGDEFCVFEGEQILTMYNTAEPATKTIKNFPAHHLQVHGLCVTSDSHWMICSVKHSHEDERTTQIGSGIIVWDMRENRIAKEVPIFNEMSNISLASDDESVLICYVNKLPSECWHLRVQETSADISLQHIYRPNSQATEFSKHPSVFGGPRDKLVLRAEIGGNIHVWDRDTAAPLCFINTSSSTPSIGEEITSFAWNKGSKDHMLAIGTRHGQVSIWTLPPRTEVPSTDIGPNSESAKDPPSDILTTSEDR